MVAVHEGTLQLEPAWGEGHAVGLPQVGRATRVSLNKSTGPVPVFAVWALSICLLNGLAMRFSLGTNWARLWAKLGLG